MTSTIAAPTTSPAPTSPPPTTPAPTTVAPTTVAPVATTAALADEEQALAVVDGFYSAWRDCLRELPTCDTSSFGAYLVDPHLENAQSSVATWQSSSYAVIDVDALAYEVAEVNLGHAIPHVVVCEVDGSSLVERRPGEPDSVVQGGYVEAIREVHLLSTSRGWRIEGFSTRDEVWDQEGALC